MDIVIDACSLINLINGQVLHKILLIPANTFYVGDNLLEQEILNDGQKLLIEAFLIDNKIQLLQSTVTLSEFKILKSRYGLGDGETECMAICKNYNFCIATDDGKARKCSVKELRKGNVIGSLYLLREAVRNDLLTCEEAKEAFTLMKKSGGFLPKIDDNYLCE